MTELSCGVARDLLPLYADNLTGEESYALVEAHLSVCEPCRAQLDALRAALPKQTPQASKSLRRIKGKLKKRLITAVSITLAAALLLSVGWYYVDGYAPPMEYREGMLEVNDPGGDPYIGVIVPMAGFTLNQYHRVDEEGNRFLWYFVHMTEPSLFTRLYFKFHELPEPTDGYYSLLSLGLRDEYGRPIKHAQHIGVYYVYDWNTFIKILDYAPLAGNDRLLDRKTGQLSEESLALCQLIWEGIVEGQ